MPSSHADTVLFTADQIRRRVAELARVIDADHSGDQPLHVVAVLKGGFVFAADLVRAMRTSSTLDFIVAASYASQTTTAGEIQLLKDLDSAIAGRQVLIVEDIIDTGRTLHYLQDVMRARAPRNLRTACLLSKPSRRQVEVPIEYLGFEIDDRFVVGYGLDYRGRYRELPYVAYASVPG